MSSEFIRYTPEIETIDPHIDELLAQIIDFWEKKGRESPVTEGTGRAVRGAHAKSFGVVKAEVQILADVPAAYAQGVYAEPILHGALIRFSSTSGHLGTDAQLGPGLGFAIKIFDVDGPKLVEDEPDSNTFDLVLKNLQTARITRNAGEADPFVSPDALRHPGLARPQSEGPAARSGPSAAGLVPTAARPARQVQAAAMTSTHRHARAGRDCRSGPGGDGGPSTSRSWLAVARSPSSTVWAGLSAARVSVASGGLTRSSLAPRRRRDR